MKKEEKILCVMAFVVDNMDKPISWLAQNNGVVSYRTFLRWLEAGRQMTLNSAKTDDSEMTLNSVKTDTNEMTLNSVKIKNKKWHKTALKNNVSEEVADKNSVKTDDGEMTLNSVKTDTNEMTLNSVKQEPVFERGCPYDESVKPLFLMSGEETAELLNISPTSLQTEEEPEPKPAGIDDLEDLDKPNDMNFMPKLAKTQPAQPKQLEGMTTEEIRDALLSEAEAEEERLKKKRAASYNRTKTKYNECKEFDFNSLQNTDEDRLKLVHWCISPSHRGSRWTANTKLVWDKYKDKLRQLDLTKIGETPGIIESYRSAFNVTITFGE